ncbi:MAG: hypothetical protein IH623_11415 [Verrucomicrobia bacterium]|nr:hypothetical protein [Verrucomicrobiota bacterium]
MGFSGVGDGFSINARKFQLLIEFERLEKFVLKFAYSVYLFVLFERPIPTTLASVGTTAFPGKYICDERRKPPAEQSEYQCAFLHTAEAATPTIQWHRGVGCECVKVQTLVLWTPGWICGERETIRLCRGLLLLPFGRQQFEEFCPVLVSDVQVTRNVEHDERPALSLHHLGNNRARHHGFAEANLICD